MPEGADSTTTGRYGPSPPGVRLRRASIGTAWNVQGGAACAVSARLLGVELPRDVGALVRSDAAAALWLGPQSWLVVRDGAPPHDFVACRDAIIAAGGALFDVSASRVAHVIAGPRASDVLAAGCPLNLDVRAFRPGSCAQSVHGRVDALYARDADDSFVVMTARSFGADVWHALCSAAVEYGYEVESMSSWAFAAFDPH